MVVRYCHVKACMLQILFFKWSKELVRFAFNSLTVLKLVVFYHSLIRCYENTIFLNDLTQKHVYRWVLYTVVWNKITQTWVRYGWLVQSFNIKGHYLIQTFEELNFIHGCYVLPCKSMYSLDCILKMVQRVGSIRS